MSIFVIKWLVREGEVGKGTLVCISAFTLLKEAVFYSFIEIEEWLY